MKNIAALLIILLYSFTAHTQNKEEAQVLIDEGVQLHDQGKYGAALQKYNQALAQDTNNVVAIGEKAMTHLSLGNYDSCIWLSKRAIETAPGSEELKMVYTTYGNALDGHDQPEEAIKVYDEGIGLFPNFFLLHFNKGITLVGLRKYDEALPCFQEAARNNPQHASSHHAIGRLVANNNKIPAIMALGVFLVMEPEGARAEGNLELLKELAGSNVNKTGKNNITINLSLPSEGEKGEKRENDFTATELIFTMSTALDHDKKNKKKSEVELFIKKMDILCSSLSGKDEEKQGFFWEYYAPYYAALQENDWIEVFSYLVFYSTGKKEVKQWHEENKKNIDLFYNWTNSFKW